MSTPLTPELSSAHPVMPTSPVTVAPWAGVSTEPKAGVLGSPSPGAAKPQSPYRSVEPPYVTLNEVEPGAAVTTMLLVATSHPARGAAPFPEDVQYVFVPTLCRRVRASIVGWP